jgi:tRNA pseudouridine38-40 synthase
MPKFKLILAYDGTAYHGWQSQPSGRGVQDHVETALARLFPSAPRLESASRTDAGVHALGMVAHFEIPSAEFRMPARHLALSINSGLPDDIRVRSATRVSETLHARFDATGKQYRYQIWNHAAMNPLLRHHAWHVPQPLDLHAMRAAAAHFIGRHDFLAFTSNCPGVLTDSVRTLTRCEIQRRGPELNIIIEGDAFLYKMCRAITGTLIQVGQGRFQPEDVPAMLASRQRATAGVNAPACGLVLWKVIYPKKK